MRGSGCGIDKHRDQCGDCLGGFGRPAQMGPPSSPGRMTGRLGFRNQNKGVSLVHFSAEKPLRYRHQIWGATQQDDAHSVTFVSQVEPTLGGRCQTHADAIPQVVRLDGLLRTPGDGLDPPTDQKVGSSNVFGRAQLRSPLRHCGGLPFIDDTLDDTSTDVVSGWRFAWGSAGFNSAVCGDLPFVVCLDEDCAREPELAA